MSIDYSEIQWIAYCHARAHAYRAMSAAYRAEASAAILDPFVRNLPARLAHLRELEDSYDKMANDLLAELATPENHA